MDHIPYLLIWLKLLVKRKRIWIYRLNQRLVRIWRILTWTVCWRKVRDKRWYDGGQFVHKTSGTSTGTISLNSIAELDNYTANQGPAGNPLNITAKVTKLPGNQMQRYAWSNSQNMITAYTANGLNNKEAKASIEFKKIKKNLHRLVRLSRNKMYKSENSCQIK